MTATAVTRLRRRVNPAQKAPNGAMQVEEGQIIADLDFKSWYKIKEIVGNNKQMVCKHGEKGDNTCISAGE